MHLHRLHARMHARTPIHAHTEFGICHCQACETQHMNTVIVCHYTDSTNTKKHLFLWQQILLTTPHMQTYITHIIQPLQQLV